MQLVFVQFTLSSKIGSLFCPAQRPVEHCGNAFQNELLPGNQEPSFTPCFTELFTTLTARILLREDWYAWECDQVSTSSVRNWSSICRMFIVNQESLPAKSARVVFWLTFSGNLRFPEPVPYWLHGVITFWSGLSSRSLRAKACLSWAGTISLKRESGIISSVRYHKCLFSAFTSLACRTRFPGSRSFWKALLPERSTGRWAGQKKTPNLRRKHKLNKN